ncbi:hypothetical protein NHQ30_011529 [Ciborinia camelliae]|nr:hypothetical protein NHQ30_011529 [Ciborinia camelliae]
MGCMNTENRRAKRAKKAAKNALIADPRNATLISSLKCTAIEDGHDDIQAPMSNPPPKPFGMGKEWYQVAAISYYNNVVLSWEKWDENTARAWGILQNTHVHAWAMNKDNDKDLSKKVLRIMKGPRRTDLQYNSGSLELQ